ncbi:TIGR02147 family protein [bacterium]|nr:TIGR02147 family protein [bacterium]
MSLGNVDIFGYTDYRHYLRDFHQVQKSENPKYSLRNFARMAGLGSPSYLTMVMKGERSLTPASLTSFSKALKHNPKQKKYFEAMVFFTDATDEDQKNEYRERMAELKPKVTAVQIKKDQYNFFTKMHYVAIHQMTCLNNFNEDASWIAKHLIMDINLAEVHNTLQALVRLGLLKRDDNGKLIPASESLTTAPELDSNDVKKLHGDILNDAKKSLSLTHHSLRGMAALTTAVPTKLIPKLKEKIFSFCQEINDWINTEKMPHNEVYQLSVQLFPLTNVQEKNKD